MKSYDYRVTIKLDSQPSGVLIDAAKAGVINNIKNRELTRWGLEVVRILKIQADEVKSDKKPVTRLMSVEPRMVYDGRAHYECTFPELVGRMGFWKAAHKAFQYDNVIHKNSLLVQSYWAHVGSRYEMEMQSGATVVTNMRGDIETINGDDLQTYYQKSPDVVNSLMGAHETLHFRDWEAATKDKVKKVTRIK